MKKIITLFILIFSMNFSEDEYKNSLVKIYSTHQQYNYQNPWQTGYNYESTATGFLINNHKIITNAHAVLNNKFLQVRKEGYSKKFMASVDFISEDYDLAILSVEDSSFFDNMTPLNFGDLPNVRDKVSIYGYPLGGDKLSITEGIISRLEHNPYTLTYNRYLVGQTDAAINSGNSGGPVISNGKVVGVAFAGLLGAENIGYFIPVNIVKHFLNDIKDGKYNGMPESGIMWNVLESPAHRKKLGVTSETKGILVKDILSNSVFEDKIKPGDVLFKLDNYEIEFDGTIEFREGERTDFEYVLQNKKFDDKISYEVFRNKEFLNGSVVLDENKKPKNVIRETSLEDPPSYYIYGGFVFEPLSTNYMSTFFIFDSSLYEKINDPDEFKGTKELVVLVKVLSDDSNIGYGNYSDNIIIEINGEKYKDFNDFIYKLKNTKGDFITLLDYDENEIVVDKKLVEERNQTILNNYGISRDRSEDIDMNKINDENTVNSSIENIETNKNN